jgi:hypothetical protein
LSRHDHVIAGDAVPARALREWFVAGGVNADQYK